MISPKLVCKNQRISSKLYELIKFGIVLIFAHKIIAMQNLGKNLFGKLRKMIETENKLVISWLKKKRYMGTSPCWFIFYSVGYFKNARNYLKCSAINPYLNLL